MTISVEDVTTLNGRVGQSGASLSRCVSWALFHRLLEEVSWKIMNSIKFCGSYEIAHDFN